MYQPACSKGDDVQGVVTSVTDYGAFVRLSNGDATKQHTSGLIPHRDMTDRMDLKPSDLVKVGETLDLVVTRIIPSKQRVNLSLKEARRRHFLRSLVVKDQVYPGRVVEVRDFGALIDLGGGVNGALYKSRHSQGRFAFVSGQPVSVCVISVDVERGRFRVATVDDTVTTVQEAAVEEHASASQPREMGALVQGTVFRVLRHAAFLDVGDGCIGILYNSRARLSPDVKNIKALTVGQTLAAKIIKIESSKRFSLSIKGVEQPAAGELSVAASKSPGTTQELSYPAVEELGATVEEHGTAVEACSGVVDERHPHTADRPAAQVVELPLGESRHGDDREVGFVRVPGRSVEAVPAFA